MTPLPEEDPVERLLDLLRTENDDALRVFLEDFPHASDIADLLEELDEDDRVRLVRVIAADPALAAETLAEMEPEEHPEDSLAALESDQLAAVVAEMSDDDAADLIGEMDKEDQDRVLAALSHEDAGDIRELMRYPEDSAGGIMTTELVAVAIDLTAAEAIEEVRRQAQEVEQLYVVFAVDGSGILRGFLPLASLVSAAPSAMVVDLIEEVPATVFPETDREEVARIVSRYNVTVVGVVDAGGRLLGGVTFDDVLDVLEEENTRDILGLGGTSQGEELRGGWADAVRSRLPWLYLNLVTAFAAASVVYAFQDVVEQVALLAVCMPVIAGLGGNTGTQALAVTVRRLALSQNNNQRSWTVLRKEILVGATNGLATGVVAATAAYFLAVNTGGSPMLAVVVLLAMWVNLAVGGFAGAFVPTVLERFGIDPAIASSIFVTTFTDTFGFFLLLGLASQILL
ncbi:MAG TPA: magnesium transporter [Longimicrobium sp.]|nr:magnesium transporter [Longimicrobium sp.]